ncbi:MAG: hypothetical protein ACYCXP_03725 [Leptospirillum sp.]
MSDSGLYQRSGVEKWAFASGNRFSREEILNRIGQVFDTVLDQTRKNVHELVWATTPSVEASWSTPITI